MGNKYTQRTGVAKVGTDQGSPDREYSEMPCMWSLVRRRRLAFSCTLLYYRETTLFLVKGCSNRPQYLMKYHTKSPTTKVTISKAITFTQPITTTAIARFSALHSVCRNIYDPKITLCDSSGLKLGTRIRPFINHWFHKELKDAPWHHCPFLCWSDRISTWEY